MFTLRSLSRAAFAAVLVLVLLGAASSAASAANRYVATAGTDAGDCVTTPCATLHYAQEQVQPGDTVHFAAGVYPIGSASLAANDVTYEGSDPGEVTITLPGDSYGVQVGGNDVTLRNLTLSSPDDTLQGDTWGVTVNGSDLTLDRMLVHHLNQGVVGGHGITVTNSTFAVNGTAISLEDGLTTATDNDFTGGGGIYVREQATVTATGNVFRGNLAGDGGNGVYVDTGSAGGTVSGNRFSPTLTFAVNGGSAIQAPDNWWGCNEGVGNAGCAESYDLPVGAAEPHLVLDVSANPNPFLTTSSSAVTASLVSSDPLTPLTGGPIGTGVVLSTSEGTLDDTHPAFVAGVAQTTLRASVAGFPTVTATLDNASASATVEAATATAAQTITFTSAAPTTATVGGTYGLTATGGASGNPVTFSIDAASTVGACTISGATVSFTGPGLCVINADQLGDAAHTAAAQEQQTVTVSAAPVTSASLSPSSFAYDAVNAAMGAAPQSETFTLTNTGNQDIAAQDPTLTGDDQADYVIGSVSCAAILQPAEQCTYVVTFAPVAVDATYDATAALNVEYAQDETVTSVLSGRVNEAPLVFEGPVGGQVDVGSSVVATATAPKSVTFTNTGRRVVRPDSVSFVAQGSGPYAITADTCTNANVAPAGRCSVTVSFTPATAGVAPATLRLAYNAGSGAVNVGLTGTGVAKQVSTDGLEVEVPSAFKTEGPGTSTSRDIVVKNTGTAGAKVGQVSVGGSAAFTISGDRCSGAVLAAEATCVVQVTFSAKAAGTHTADLVVPSSQGNVTVPLTGTMTQAVLPLGLDKVRAPVRCLTYGAATPSKSIALKTNAKADVGWTIKKARGSKALLKCPPAPNSLKHSTKSGQTKGSGVVETNAAGSANVTLSTLLPAGVRKAMKPGLYRVTFVARNVTGSSPERVVLIRVLKQPERRQPRR